MMYFFRNYSFPFSISTEISVGLDRFGEMLPSRASILLLLCLLPTVMVFGSVSVLVGDAEHHKPKIDR